MPKDLGAKSYTGAGAGEIVRHRTFITHRGPGR